MNTNEIAFFQFLKEGITKEPALGISNTLDWEWIYGKAQKNKLSMLLYHVTEKYSREQLEESRRDSLKSMALNRILKEAGDMQQIRKILSVCKDNGLMPVIFKGVVLSELYPQHLLRGSGDTDVYVYQQDRDQMIQTLEELGYQKDLIHSKEMVPVYIEPESRHVVEVHYSLWEDYKGQKMDLLEEMQLVSPKSLLSTTACNMEVMTLGYTEHLIYQMFHIIKHFATELVQIRYLADVTLFINAYAAEIDWIRFWDSMKILNYQVFCKTFFSLCVDQLGMKPEALNHTAEIALGNKELLIRELFYPGGEEQGKRPSWQFFGLITPYLQGEEEAADSSFRQKLKMLFPSPKALPDKCWYAKKYPILLPIAWAHKIFGWLYRYICYYVKRKDRSSGDLYSAREKLAAAEYRISLMREMGLLDSKKGKLIKEHRNGKTYS